MDDLEEKIVAGIKLAMREKKVSQTALSKQIDIPYRSLQNYLSGATKMPAVVYVKICDDLGIDNQFVLNQSFEFAHDAFRDALWHVFGDGLLKVELKENSSGAHPNTSEHNRKQEIVYELTVKLNKTYDRYRREELNTRATRGREATSTEKASKVGQ